MVGGDAAEEAGVVGGGSDVGPVEAGKSVDGVIAQWKKVFVAPLADTGSVEADADAAAVCVDADIDAGSEAGLELVSSSSDADGTVDPFGDVTTVVSVSVSHRLSLQQVLHHIRRQSCQSILPPTARLR